MIQIKGEYWIQEHVSSSIVMKKWNEINFEYYKKNEISNFRKCDLQKDYLIYNINTLTRKLNDLM